jgi:signal transduction histidine kinase
MCRPKASKASILLRNLCDGDIFIRGDRLQLERVFRDLIDNGLNAMKGGELTVETHVDRENERVRVHVNDQGYGMSKEMIEAILSDARNLSSEHRVPLGTALARFVIEHHGGTLQFRSTVEEGTTALITLPYVRLGK